MNAQRPALRVVRGEPTPEELAVLTAMVAAAGGESAEAPPPRRGRWADPGWAHHGALRIGPGAWRAATAPR